MPGRLCDGHEVFFLAASGQIRMTASNLVIPRRESCDQAPHRLQGGRSVTQIGQGAPNLHIRPSYVQLSIISKELLMSVIWTRGRSTDRPMSGTPLMSNPCARSLRLTTRRTTRISPSSSRRSASWPRRTRPLPEVGELTHALKTEQGRLRHLGQGSRPRQGTGRSRQGPDGRAPRQGTGDERGPGGPG